MGVDIEMLREIWAKYIYEDRLDPRVKPEVAECWKKCKSAGVDPINGGIGTMVDSSVFQSILDENRLLVEITRPIMKRVFDIVKRSHFMLVLTDSAGYILEAMGDKESLDEARASCFRAGVRWNTLSVGANAIGAALDCDTNIQMVGPEHYCLSHHGGVCSASVIHGADGEIVGCLNLSSTDVNSAHDHTLGLVMAAAYGVEGQLALHRNAELMRSALDGITDGYLMVDRSYHIEWANGAALKLLECGMDEARTLDIRGIMPDVDWGVNRWKTDARYFSDDLRVICAGRMRRCCASIFPTTDKGMRTLNVTLKRQKHLFDSVNRISSNRAIYTFADICTVDQNMRQTLLLAEKYARYDGNIYIEGESGTGKELIAQAIHNAGSRADGPFVVVNCASIPRDMLEMELFGYEARAFPGISEDGNPGRFELANHGTLFLDEISEVPLEFQSKLLRMVETHCISRIGGSEETPLDFRLIVSSNRRLEQLTTRGSFRSDLYFRINVLRLDIPPLRERPGDIAMFAESFLERMNSAHTDDIHKTMLPEFMDGLMSYSWPGNVRELQNGIERAFYSSAGDSLGADSLKYVFSAVNIDRPEADGGQKDADAREIGAIRSTLVICGGNIDTAAEKLGISRATLYRRLKKYGISPKLEM